MDSVMLLVVAAAFLAVVFVGAIFLKKKNISLEDNKNTEILLDFLTQLTKIVYDSIEDESEQKKYVGYVHDMTRIGVSLLRSMEDIQDKADANVLKEELYNSILIIMNSEGKVLDDQSRQFLNQVVDFLVEEYNQKG